MTEASLNETPLPRSIQRQMLRVKERIEAKTNPDPGATPPNADVTDTAGTEPAPQGDSKPAPAADPRENDPAYWRQRFNVTQGMLRSLQERTREEAAAKEQELTELRERVATLEAQTAATPGKPDIKAFFTDEQIAQFGEEQCEAMAGAAVKAARDQAQTLIDAQVKPIKDKTQRDTAAAEQRAEDEFWEKLAELTPDYDEVNKDPAWLVWLAEEDDQLGEQRQLTLNRFRARRDAAKVSAMFERFKKQAGKAPTAQPPVAPRGGPGGGGNEAPPSNQPAKGYPTSEEKKDFYKRAKLGKVSDKERLEFEARLKSQAAA